MEASPDANYQISDISLEYEYEYEFIYSPRSGEECLNRTPKHGFAVRQSFKAQTNSSE